MVVGSLLTSTTTDPTGWYGLTTEAICEYYNILETDPPGFESDGATTVDGEVINDNWIEYAGPVSGLTLTGNKFWDLEIDPPPGGWGGFWPTGWVNTRTVSCGIEVSDSGSGLDPATAEFSTTSDGGSSWSEWMPAECTGDPGSNGPEIVTAADADFTADAGPDQLTRIRFRISDLDGNQGTSSDHPVEIDSIAPSSHVVELDPCFGVLSFPVSWSADPADGSPIVSYDVWVEDKLDGATVAEFEWQMDTTITSAEFDGEFSHDYTFSSRATDEAGNSGAYSAFGDTSTAIGCDLTVEVLHQSGAIQPNAKVYFNTAYLGSADGAGTILAPDVMLGDELLALSKIHEEPSLKPHHGSFGSSNWAYKVYLTSFALAPDGTALLHEVSNLTTNQILTVRPDRTLVGFHVLGSIEHDAQPDFVNAIRRKLEDASEFLYDVGDGQFFFDVVEIRDDSVYRAESDFKFYASNTGTPWAFLGAIEVGTTMHIYIPRHTKSEVLIHEWGHYGLWLWDEYLNPFGKNTHDSYCSSNFFVPPKENRASIMHDPVLASELCSRVDPSHTHRTNTMHDAKTNGMTTWETLDQRYTDASGPQPLWEIVTPDERGSRMPGPGAPPAAWTTYVVVDADTGACGKFYLNVRDSAGKKVVGARVGLDRYPREWLYQGITEPSGAMVIIGAHIGDRLWVESKDGGYFSQVLTSCSSLFAHLGYPINPSAVNAKVLPLAHDQIEIQARPEHPLAANPVAEIWQEGRPSPIPIELIWDPVPGAYVGQATLDQDHEQGGTIKIEATFADRTETVVRRPSFRIHQITAEEHTPRIYSHRGDFELILPAQGLDTDASLSVQTELEVGPPPEGLMRLSPAYGVEVSTGQRILNDTAAVTIVYSDVVGLIADLSTLDIHYWDPVSEAWIATDARVSPEHSLATTDISELVTVALMGETSILFSDNFEDGSTSAWSWVVP